MRKIQFFLDKFGYGSKESQIITLASSLVDLFKIEIVCLEKSRDINFHKNIRLVEIDRKNFFVSKINEINLVKDINKRIEEFTPDIIIVNDEIYNKWFEKISFNNSRLLFWLHNISDSKKEYEKLNKYDFVIVSSEYAKKSLQERIKNVKVIPNAVDLGVKKDNYDESSRIVTVSKLVINDSFMKLMELMQELTLYKKDIVLNIIGDGPDRNEIANVIKEHKLDKNIHLFGFFGEHDLNEELVASSLFISTVDDSLFELSVLEAMSVGLPVVVFESLGFIKEIVTDDIDGILVKNNDLKDMVREIFDLLENKDRRENIGSCAIEKSLGYNINVIKIEWIKLFN